MLRASIVAAKVEVYTRWGRKTYHISKLYYGNDVLVIHIIGVHLGRD